MPSGGMMRKARLEKKEEDLENDLNELMSWMAKFRNYLLEGDTDGSDKKVILQQFKMAIRKNRYFKATRWHTVVREVKGYIPLDFL